MSDAETYNSGCFIIIIHSLICSMWGTCHGLRRRIDTQNKLSTKITEKDYKIMLKLKLVHTTFLCHYSVLLASFLLLSCNAL